jgi:uncharacterized coiled-coil protein SlyX
VDLEQRLIELETKVLFQERTIEELHEALYQQQKVILVHEKNFELFKKEILDTLNDSQEIRGHEKPPHY